MISKEGIELIDSKREQLNKLLDECFIEMEIIDEVRRIIENCRTNEDLLSRLSDKMNFFRDGMKHYEALDFSSGMLFCYRRWFGLKKLIDQIKALIESEA